MNHEDKKKNSISPLLENISQQQVVVMDQDNTDGEGWDYYCNGQVVHAVVFKNEISGIVREYLDDYKVQIRADEFEISCMCTCDSENVICKHVVALLYSWVNDKSDFINLQNFIEELEIMDKESLIKAVEQFIADDPRNIKFFEKQKNYEQSNMDYQGLIFD